MEKCDAKARERAKKRSYTDFKSVDTLEDDASGHAIFELQLKRAHPQVSRVLNAFDDFLSNALEGVKSLSEVELEATFGSMVDGKFSHSISKTFFQSILTCLSQSKDYEYRSNWFLVYDYDMGDRTRLRVSMENENRKTCLIRKVALRRLDLRYDSRNAAGGADTVRINAKLELKEPKTAKIVEFSSVRISIRLYFTFASSNFPGVLWKMELVQYWVGDTVSKAEESMRTEEPTYCFECEVVNLTSDCVFTRKDRITLACSILLKMEDFIQMPFLLENMSRPAQERDTSSILGEFVQV